MFATDPLRDGWSKNLNASYRFVNFRNNKTFSPQSEEKLMRIFLAIGNFPKPKHKKAP